jgi:hypothetical protein
MISQLPGRMQAKIQFEICLVPGLDPTCWTWTGAANNKNYGCVGYQGRSMLTHRRAYELLVGPIPPGFHVDHLCKNTRCCHPAHLEAVTPRVNTRRALSDTVRACVHGHEYTPENTIVKKNGQRNCRTCANQWQRDYRSSLKVAA